jgi:hypothetical protein
LFRAVEEKNRTGATDLERDLRRKRAAIDEVGRP